MSAGVEVAAAPGGERAPALFLLLDARALDRWPGCGGDDVRDLTFALRGYLETHGAARWEGSATRHRELGSRSVGQANLQRAAFDSLYLAEDQGELTGACPAAWRDVVGDRDRGVLSWLSSGRWLHAG